MLSSNHPPTPPTIPSYRAHQKSYLKGYMRCTNCYAWFHPDNPKDRELITVGKNGYRTHKECPVRSTSPPAMITTPRHKATKARRLAGVKRY